MPISLHKQTKQSTGLDIDGAYIAGVTATGGRVTGAASLDLPEGVVVDGEVRDALTLSSSLKELFKSSGLPKDVRLGVSNQQIVVRQLELPRIEDPEDADQAIRFQAAEVVPMPADEAILDHQPIAEVISAEGVASQRILLVAARRTMIDLLVEAVRSAGLRPLGIDLNAFALVRTLAQPQLDTAAPPAPIVFCHLAGVTNLAVAVGPDCLFTRSLTTSWQGDDDEVVPKLAEEMRLSIDYYLAQPDARPVEKAFLSGPGAARATLAEHLNELTDLEVTVAPPLGLLSPLALPPGEDPNRHTVAAGLALGAVAQAV